MASLEILNLSHSHEGSTGWATRELQGTTDNLSCLSCGHAALKINQDSEAHYTPSNLK